MFPIGPRCHGGASSLLRMGLGLGAVPQRLAAPSRLLTARPFFLRQRMPSTQLDLFSHAGARA